MIWNIRQFFHHGNQSVVEWYFKDQMKNGKYEEFEGMSLIVWSKDDRIKELKEFGCNTNNYDPYRGGNVPVFNDEKINWF